jgi:hypothetical protein
MLESHAKDGEEGKEAEVALGPCGFLLTLADQHFKVLPSDGPFSPQLLGDDLKLLHHVLRTQRQGTDRFVGVAILQHGASMSELG